MVISVSNLVLSTLVSSLVVWAMRVFSSFRKESLVAGMILRSYLAWVKASVESRVQISCSPSRPTCADGKQHEGVAQRAKKPTERDEKYHRGMCLKGQG